MSATAVEERQRETGGASAPTEEGAGRRRGVVVVGCALAALVLAGVTTWALIGRDEGESGRGTVPSSEVARWDASVQDAARRVDELERALRSPQNQPDGSEVFTQDAVWEDWGVRFVGFDEVMGFLRMWALTSGATSSEYTRSYAGHSGGVATESSWGAFGWTKEEPGLWLTELSIRDGKIAVVRLLGDLGVMEADRLPPGVETPAPATVQAIRDLARAYAGAWSSGDPAAVGRLYADDAAREDMVLGETGVGRAEIEAIASRFHGRYPGARFAVVRPYSVGEPAVPGRPVIAAELALAVPAADGTPCTVKAVAVLETQEGLISRERVYYNADSLVDCGWAR